MGTKLSDIEVGSPLSLRISANNKSMMLDAVIKKHVSENTVIIGLLDEFQKKLNFGTVRTDIEFYPPGTVPLKWNNVSITSYEDDYILQASSEGAKNNRRTAFRVGISLPAKLETVIPNCPRQATIRDVSLSGFSIADRKGELPFQLGNTISVSWDDMGHVIELAGRLVRIEQRTDVTIFGFEICNICKDLSSYITVKQRQVKAKEREKEKRHK